MNRNILITLPLGLFSVLSVSAGEATNYRVKLEEIKVSTETLLSLIQKTKSTGTPLRDAVQKLIINSQAELKNLTLTTLHKTNLSSSNSSHAQLVYPTEYEPSNQLHIYELPEKISIPIGMHENYEEYNVGTSSKFSIDFNSKTKLFTIEVKHFKNDFRGFHTVLPVKHAHGSADVVMPNVDSKHLEKKFQVKSNKYQLIHFAPTIQADGKNSTTQSIATFIRTTPITTK